MEFSEISWLAVLLAAVAFFAVGGLWYGLLFSKLWMRLSGMTEERARQSNIPLAFGLTAVLGAVAAIGLAAIVGADPTVGEGLGVGLGVGLLIAAPVLAIQSLYERKPWLLLALNAGYNLIGFAVMGLIIGALQ
jgi:hypothetical protein